MKIGLVSSAVPLVQGGGRLIVDWLASKLTDAGHRVETVWIPFLDVSNLLAQMTAFRLIDLEQSFDRVITFRPPAHVVKHRNKVVWFIHHIRGFYDLWDTDYRPVPDTAYWQAFRRNLMIADTNALLEASRLFTNSRIVADRLMKFNGLRGEVLYPPVLAPERFHNEAWGGEIVCICRMEAHKRQHLLVEAMRHVKTPVRLRLVGETLNPHYVAQIQDVIRQFDLEEKVTVDRRWISEGEKVSLLSTALASACFPFDEDSYGYPTIEAALACKATIGPLDGGGVSEFIIHNENGYLLPPDPKQIAETFDGLWADRKLARRLGETARDRIGDLRITWDHVIERLLS